MATYVARPGDTLEKIAAHCLGSKSAWPRIYEMNAGSMDAAFDRAKNFLADTPGHHIRKPWDWLEIGQALELPADAVVPSSIIPFRQR